MDSDGAQTVDLPFPERDATKVPSHIEHCTFVVSGNLFFRSFANHVPRICEGYAGWRRTISLTIRDNFDTVIAGHRDTYTSGSKVDAEHFAVGHTYGIA